MKYSDSDISRARSNIAETIGRYLQITKHGSEFKACCPFHDEKTPSFTIVPDKGFFHCFGCGESGDAIDFVMKYAGKTFPEAIESIAGFKSEPSPVNHQVEKKSIYTPMPVVPAHAGKPPFNHFIHGDPSQFWEYKTADGQTIGYVCRFDFAKPDGIIGKETIPLCYARKSDTGTESWRWLSFAKPRPIYGLPRLAMDGRVIICEGEKAADAAQAIFKSNPCITWPGGTQAIKFVDWSPLSGRDVILWPDNDKPGVDCMHALAAILHPVCKSVNIVTPPDFGTGWDL